MDLELDILGVQQLLKFNYKKKSMKKNEFIKLLAEYCEFETQDFVLETKFNTINGYDSLAIMSMIAFVDENFNLKITANQIRELTDFNSLIHLIGENKFE